MEIPVEFADPAEVFGCCKAHDLVDDATQRHGRAARGDGNGDHDRCGAASADRLDRGLHARAGRDSIVDEDRRSSARGDRPLGQAGIAPVFARFP